MLQSLNPYTNQIIAEYGYDSAAIIDEKINLLSQGSANWAKQEMFLRLEGIKLLKTSLERKINVLSDSVTAETGKPISQSRLEIEKCIQLCNYYNEVANNLFEPEFQIYNDSKAIIIRQPLGIILGIMPWNFPIWQTLRFAIPTIIAGNSVAIKPAPNTVQSSKLLESLFHEIGHESIFQLFLADHDQIAELIADSKIKGVSFTGSSSAGAKIGGMASSSLKPSVLELGGSDPMIVTEDFPLDEAIDIVIKSRFNNNGQSCIAAKRLFVPKKQIDLYNEKLIFEITKLIKGDPQIEETFISCLARPDLAENLQKQYESLTKQNAKVHLEGGRSNELNSIFDPVLIELNPSLSNLWKEECFGPLLCITPYDTIQQAVELANSTPYGLGATICSNDNDLCNYLSLTVKAGYVSVNSLLRSDPRFPFGGLELSGYGKELGREGAFSFTNQKTIVT